MPVFSTGRRPARPEPVMLNVYDLHPQNDFLGMIGFGVFHTGLVVHGQEWSFGSGSSGSGIFSHTPKQAQGAKFRLSIKLGETTANTAEVERIVDNMKPQWQSSDYSLILKNCNCFTDALARELLGHGIPPWVNRLSSIGQMVSCCLPQTMGGSAPVNGGEGEGTQGSSSAAAGRAGAGGGRGAAKPASSSRFAGEGHRLGATSTAPGASMSSTSAGQAGRAGGSGRASSAAGGAGSLQSSRELALAAAMKRIAPGPEPGEGAEDRSRLL